MSKEKFQIKTTFDILNNRKKWKVDKNEVLCLINNIMSTISTKSKIFADSPHYSPKYIRILG